MSDNPPMLLKGLACPHCRCKTLRVVQVYHPCPGLVTRSRECVQCRRRVMTEERIRRPRITPPRPIEPVPAT